MDNCSKWQNQKLQKLAKRIYRICFDLTRRYFGVSLFFTQKIAKFYRVEFRQTRFETAGSKGPFIFYEHGGGWWDLGGGGATRKKMALKGGATKKNWVKEGGVTSNNWLVGEIESGSTQKQMKKLNIISILFNTIFLTTFNLF